MGTVASPYHDPSTREVPVLVIKIQNDPGQAVITTGPYAIVCQPVYFGALFYVAHILHAPTSCQKTSG